jgi:uncharacterized protein YndB with AHSA1/START domain
MATIRKEITIDVPPEDAWSALRDWSALHTRLAPGFVTDLQLDGQDRVITFFNGAVVRERLVTIDEQERRLVWSIIEGPYAHHNGSAQAHTASGDATRFVWTADVLPDDLAQRTEAMMEHGINMIKETLEATLEPVP